MADKRRKKRPFSVDLTLTPEDRKAYLALLADVRTTIAVAQDWLKQKGYLKLSFGAVNRHRQHILNESDDLRRWAAVASNLAAAAEAGGGHTLAAGTLAKFEQMVLEVLYTIKESRTLTPHELADLAAALNKTVATRTQLEGLQLDAEKRQRKAARKAKQEKKPTATPEDVAERMRVMLGLKTRAVPLQPRKSAEN